LCLNINIAHLVNIEDFYDLIQQDIRDCLLQNLVDEREIFFLEDKIKIKSFNDLFDILQDLGKFYDIYLVSN
jgi:hypothetical protein